MGERGDATAQWTIRVGAMQLAGLASIGAGAIHAGVAGVHADSTTLARLFVAAAVAQVAVGVAALVRGGRLVAVGTAVVNLVAVGAWGATRIWGFDVIAGLETAERPGFADITCASLGAVAVVAAVAALVTRQGVAAVPRLGVPAVVVAALALSGMLAGTSHDHGDAAGHDHGADLESVPTADDGHDHDHGDAEVGATGDDASVGLTDATATEWPRPWDPATGIDLSGVPGATRAQELRAAGLIERTLADLPQFADVATAEARGYQSIGDAATGFEHYIDYSLFGDGRELDPNAPESLVYRVDGADRTLVSAMYIVTGTAIDDPELVDYGGPLMQWHVHDNLCWVAGDDGPKVIGTTDDNGGVCPAGSANLGGEFPMVHVWIVPHECGPFAALEGHGAGQAAIDDSERVDQCAHGGHGDHGESHDHGAADVAGADPAAAAPTPYDPQAPIDLSGTAGVTAEQQAFAENLVARTLYDLPQWADTAVAEEAGFHSIGDEATGYEHYINWDWINDDVVLDPDRPESVVYRVEADGSRTLVSAMYMLSDDTALGDVPDWGGALMQWHVHNDLCFDTSGDAPVVGGLTDAAGTCTPPLEPLGQAPMIHVWIVPHECGPFAALEGVAAGQVADGEDHLCDHAHGSH